MKKMKKYKIGYTQGTFDMFHIGHLNLLHQAKDQCEKLMVGINTDILVREYKHKTPVVCDSDRLKIVEEMRCVDEVFLCNTLNKCDIWQDHHFDAIFIGSDWKGNDRWKQTENDLKQFGAEVVYLRHTDGVSSTLLRDQEKKRIND